MVWYIVELLTVVAVGLVLDEKLTTDCFYNKAVWSAAVIQKLIFCAFSSKSPISKTIIPNIFFLIVYFNFMSLIVLTYHFNLLQEL